HRGYPRDTPAIRLMDQKGLNVKFVRGQPQRFRFLRNGNTCRCIMGDQIVIESQISTKQQFRRVLFAFADPDFLVDGGARELGIYEVSLRAYAQAEAKLPFTPFHEDFRAVNEAEIPKGWSGPSALGVSRAQTTSWLQY